MKAYTFFGPPGTGKTKTLVSHILDYQDRPGVPVTFISFTKAAAQEATSRIKMNNLRVSTLHSMALNVVGGAGSVVNDAKMASFSRITGIPFKASDSRQQDLQEGDEYVAALSYARNRLIDPMEAYDHFGRPGSMDRLQMFIAAYPMWKESTGFIDFDDMLVRFVDCLRTHPQMSWPVLFLDEAQDCTPLQWKIIRMMAERATSVYIAGDDDQAIFEWNGADPHGMISFSEDVGADVKVLAKSWRVPATAHGFVHSCILDEIKTRVPKTFSPADRHGRVTRYGDIESMNLHARTRDGAMILARDRFRVAEICRLLNQDMIPYRCIGGPSPFDSKIARAIRGLKKMLKGEPISTFEGNAMLELAADPEIRMELECGDLQALSRMSWRQVFNVPAHLMHFYESADLDAPLNVVVSTIHQAKGKEANNVIVDLTLSPRTQLSAQLDPDAELRVMYVACTRAAQELSLCGENLVVS